MQFLKNFENFAFFRKNCKNDTTKPSAQKIFEKIAKNRKILQKRINDRAETPQNCARRQFWAPAEKFLALKIGAGRRKFRRV